MTEMKTDWPGMDGMADTWMKSVNELLENMHRIWFEPLAKSVDKRAEEKTAADSAKSSMAAAMKNWKAVSTALSDIESMGPFLKTTETMPGMVSKLAQVTFGGFTQLQQKWLEFAGRVGKTTESYPFEDIDENIFRAWSEIYEKEFRQFFKIPQLGLTRSYQEKMNLCADQYNRFQSTMAEYLRFLSLPLARSYAEMQEKVGEMSESGELPEDPKVLYQLWIKTLEGQYMTLYQSAEYSEMLGKTLLNLSELSRARRALMEDMLSVLPIPRQTEIDDMAKDIYELKRGLRELKKQLK